MSAVVVTTGCADTATTETGTDTAETKSSTDTVTEEPSTNTVNTEIGANTVTEEPSANTTETRTTADATDTTAAVASPALNAVVTRQPGGSAPGQVKLRLHNDTARTLDIRFGNVPPFSRFSSASVAGRRLLFLPTIDRQATSPPVAQLIPEEPTDRQIGDVPCWTATGELYLVQFFTDNSLQPGDSVVRLYTVVWASDSDCGPGTYSFERTTSNEAPVRLNSTVEITVATDGSLSATAETDLV